MPPAHGNAPLRWFATNQPAGGLPGPVYNLVRYSGEARVATAMAIVVCPGSGGAIPPPPIVPARLGWDAPLLGAADEAFALLLTDEGLQAWAARQL